MDENNNTYEFNCGGCQPPAAASGTDRQQGERQGKKLGQQKQRDCPAEITRLIDAVIFNMTSYSKTPLAKNNR